MGFWLGGRSTVLRNLTFAPNERRIIGVSPSIRPANANQDLRHPNPVRSVSSDMRGFSRTPTRDSRRSYRTLSGPLSFLATPPSRVVAQDQRIVVVEDKRDG